MSKLMALLTFYRFSIALALGIAAALLFVRTWWFGLLIAAAVRICWAIVEHFIKLLSINRRFTQHAFTFKQQLGPYGIRMINKAETDASVKKSLAEVFTNDEKKLRKAVETLEMMDTLFRAGMRPDGEAYQLHDLKLKYGKWRLGEMGKGTAAGTATSEPVDAAERSTSLKQ